MEKFEALQDTATGAELEDIEDAPLSSSIFPFLLLPHELREIVRPSFPHHPLLQLTLPDLQLHLLPP